MIIQRLFSQYSREQKEFARRDYEGLDKKAKKELRSIRNISAQYLNNVRNSNNSSFLNKEDLLLRNKFHDLAIDRLNTTDIDRERLLRESKKRNLKKAGKGALIAGGVVAAGIGAKKLVDKKKAKKDDSSKK